tara:strand:+ start:209 stop:547 length:339 start_codon:yes stop_codon:yes gene_type:complete
MEDKLNKLIFLTEEGNNLKREIIKLLSKGTSTVDKVKASNIPKEKYTLEDVKRVVTTLIKQKDLTESNHKFIENVVDFCKQKGYVTAKQFMSISNMLQDNFHYMNKINKSYE